MEQTRARKRHLRDLIDRLFSGEANTLVAGLIDDAALDRRELEELRARIDEKLGKRGGGR